MQAHQETDETRKKKVIVMTALYTSKRYELEEYKASKPFNVGVLARAMERLAPLPEEPRSHVSGT